LSGGRSPFTDELPDWAYGEIVTAANKSWINGYPDGTFGATKNITRAEVVTIVNRVLERSVTIDVIPSSYDRYFTDLRPDYWAFADIIEASVKHDYRVIDGKEVWE
jgi:hypothetical protein